MLAFRRLFCAPAAATVTGTSPLFAASRGVSIGARSSPKSNHIHWRKQATIPTGLLPGETEADLREKARLIFGNLPMDGIRSGQKYLRKKLVGPAIADWYFTDRGVPPEKAGRMVMPGFKTQKEIRDSEKLFRLKRQGKGPPTKGMGKRSKIKGGKK